MKTYKCLKAIKKNSQTNDGHPDGTELLIFAEKIFSEEVKKEAIKAGAKMANKMYYALVKNLEFPELMEYVPLAVLDYKVDIITDELIDLNIEDENLINHLNDLEEKLFIPLEFTFYN